jgi:hypothetical protein
LPSRPRGPLAPLTSAYNVAQGRKDIGQALSNIFTFSPAVKMLTQGLANSDPFRRQIIEQASPPQQKLLQALHYGAKRRRRSRNSAMALPNYCHSVKLAER